ncbi:hypothetical protein RhiirC2_771392 [Rhizophagus irregularis]|uniref:Uncharacterized protein n=1 Tax=Rhizophagus irregularis TaxID=588596 RepID=A0A2N1NU38_9GLOM|nr:hypothetical protein RhiirC2_771392 [Rhizophagus irregularis]
MPLQYPSHLLKLQDSALATIDEHSYIKAHNRYYWIAGLGESDSMIFKRVFYTVDVYGTQIVQRDDIFILALGIFLWSNGPISPLASELEFILRVLQMLPQSQIQELRLDCNFQTIMDVSTDLYLFQCLALAELSSYDDPSLHFNLLIDSFSFQRLLVASLCTEMSEIPLVIDSVIFWQTSQI